MITFTITSSTNIIVFIFPQNNSNRNCNTSQKPQLLQTITFIKSHKNVL